MIFLSGQERTLNIKCRIQGQNKFTCDRQEMQGNNLA